MKSYGVDTSPKCTKYIFPYENGSSLLIKWYLEKPWGGSQSKVNGSFDNYIMLFTTGPYSFLEIVHCKCLHLDYDFNTTGRFTLAGCRVEQPKQKSPRGFSLFQCSVFIGDSESIEENILQQPPLGVTS